MSFITLYGRGIAGHRQSAQRSARISAGAKPAFLLPPAERPVHGKKTAPFLHSSSNRNRRYLCAMGLWISVESSEQFPSSLICKCILVYACIDQCYTYRSALNTDSGCIEVRITHQEVMATDKGPGTLHFPRSAPSHTDECSSLSKYTTLALSAKRCDRCMRTSGLCDFKLVCTHTVHCTDTKTGQHADSLTRSLVDHCGKRMAKVYFGLK